MAFVVRGLRVEGVKGLAENLARLPLATARKKQIEALKLAAEPIRDQMGRNAPRGREPLREGRVRLAGSMTISTVRARRGSTDATVAVGPGKGAFHGLFQERGTIHHGPQPFATAALNAKTKEALQIFGDEMWFEIRSVIRSTGAVPV